MWSRCLAGGVVVGVVIAAGGCRNADTVHYRSVKRMDRVTANYGAHFTYMVDSAIARDMSVADMHFIPHSTEINGVGEVRLLRMAELLKTYGGNVRYETMSRDEDLVRQRISHVREYLAAAGCDMQRVSVAPGISGGGGRMGNEAVETINEGTKQATGQGTEMPAGFSGLTGAPQP